MSPILNYFFKTLFTAPTCFDSISLIIIREHIFLGVTQTLVVTPRNILMSTLCYDNNAFY